MLPLYRSETLAGVPLDRVVVLTEGEKAADAVARAGLPALGTVTGASSAHTTEAVATAARGRRFLLWPDHDEAGRLHMTRQAAALRRAGAERVAWLLFRPSSPAADWPKGTDAADLLAGLEPAEARELVRQLAAEWAQPVPDPPAPPKPRRPAGPVDASSPSVSAALAARYGLEARPGRVVRCPRHDDRHASLSILRDDLRAICHAAGCEWSGRGVIAADVLAEGVHT
jgi:hypothetical protein